MNLLNIFGQQASRLTLKRRAYQTHGWEELYWTIQESYLPEERPYTNWNDLGTVSLTRSQANIILQWVEYPGTLERKQSLIRLGARTPAQVPADQASLSDEELLVLEALQE